MAIKTSTLMGTGRDDDRWSPGFVIPAGVVLYGGMVVTQDLAAVLPQIPAKTLKPFNGVAGTDPLPVGLVYENTTAFLPGGASGDQAAGKGFDSLDYARGGMYSAFHRPGNIVDVFDDGRDTTSVSRARNAGGAQFQGKSAPFIITDSFTVGVPVFCTTEGLLTVDNTGATTKIGIVRAVEGSGATTRFSLELQIALV